MAKLTKKARRLAALKGWRRRNAPRRRNAGGTSTASRTATRTATEATTTGNKTSTSTGGASTSGGNVSISVKHNPATRVGGKGLTLRNMAVVTVKRLPGGAVAITGRKLNPGKLGSQGIDFRASRIRFSSWYATKKEALRAIPRLKETFRRDTGGKELRSPKVEKDPRGGYIITRLTSQGARRKR